MNYIRIPLLPRTDFSFEGVASSVQEVQLIKYIPVPRVVSGVFELRVAARSALASQSIKFVLQPTSPASDDPATQYKTTERELIATVDSSVTAPLLIQVSLGTPVADFYRLIVRATQHTTASVMTTTVSAALVGRDA